MYGILIIDGNTKGLLKKTYEDDDLELAVDACFGYIFEELETVAGIEDAATLPEKDIELLYVRFPYMRRFKLVYLQEMSIFS